MGCCDTCFAKCDPCCKRLGCGCKDKDDDGRMATIAQDRSCTDIPCLGVFGAFVAFLVIGVWSTAMSEGDPDRLVRGVNHAGKICGKSDGVKHLPYAFWPDPTEYRFKVCTNDCNEATMTNFLTNHIIVSGSNIGYPSELYIDKYCSPSAANLNIAGFDDYSNEVQRGMGDIETAMPIIGASIAIAFVMSFLYVFLMKTCVGVLVWGTVALIVAGGAGLGLVLYSSKDDANLSSNEMKMREYIAYVVFALTAIFLCIIIFARNRILIAIQVIKSAGRAVGDMPMMVLFPLGPLSAIIGFFFAWCYASIYIFSAGEEKQIESPEDFENASFSAEGDAFSVGATYTVLDYDSTIQNAFAPHFFLLLWTVQIGVYLTFAVIAGAVADWYFTERDEDGDKIRGNGDMELSRRPVLKSCCRTVRFHLGTILFAALIIAIIQFVRWCVRYAERMMNASGKEPNKIQKLLFRVVDCLLWCLECCLDKVSRNALIWLAIYGDAFCPSVCGSFKLMWANLVRVAVITFFSTIVTALGKIMIPLATTGVCAVILLNVEKYNSQLSSPIYALVVIFIISMAVALMFLTVYDTAIDTVFMCFLIDEKHNKANGRMLADEGLRSIVQKYEAESKKLAHAVQGGHTRSVLVSPKKDNAVPPHNDAIEI